MKTEVFFNDIAVEVTHTNVHVERILQALGNKMKLCESGFELEASPFDVLISGDDGYAPVTAISVCNGHLILVAHFGDDGEFVFSPTAPAGMMGNDLPAAIIDQMDQECPTLSDETININPAGGYLIGQYFTGHSVN